MAERSNEKWVADLQATGALREDALADLRQILVHGLQFGLRKYLSPTNPNFAPLVEESFGA